MRDMVLYGVLRLALWAVIWWLLTVAGMGVILAGVLAALIAMLISILALNRLRDSAAMRWKEADDRRRERKGQRDRKSTRLNSSHVATSYAVFCLKKKIGHIAPHLSVYLLL